MISFLTFLFRVMSALLLVASSVQAATPDLRVWISPPEAATAQQSFTSTLQVQNVGSGKATGIRFTNVLSGGGTVLNAWSAAGRCVVTGNTVTCDLGSLDFAYTANVYVQVVAASPGFVTNTVSAGLADAETTYTNNATHKSVRVTTEKFFGAGNMLAGRAGHVALRLNDGRVLLIGGGPAQDEFYDPATRQFTAVPPVNRRGNPGAATLLNDGRVFILSDAPGTNGWVVAGQIFDPAALTYGNAVVLAGGYISHLAATLLDGTVLVVQRVGQSSFTFDPASLTFTPRSNLVAMQYVHGLTRLADGSVLAIGPTNVVERYWPASGQFVTAGTLHRARNTHTATPLEDGRVLIVGDQDYTGPYPAEIYDPVTGTFTQTATSKGILSNLSASRLPGNRVFFVSGTVAEIYDVAGGTFLPTVGPEKARLSPVLTALDDGTLFLSGGQDSYSPPFVSAEIFDADNLHSLPRWTISDTAVLEGTATTNQAQFLVSLWPVPTNAMTVNLTTFTATADHTDFGFGPTTVTFPAGVTNQIVSVPVHPDGTYEQDEVFPRHLINPIWAVAAKRVGLGTILNDDAPPVFSVPAASVVEPNVGWTNLEFKIRLTGGPTAAPSTVEFATASGTAVAGSDFIATNGTLVFLPGSLTTQSVHVQVRGDVLVEPT